MVDFYALILWDQRFEPRIPVTKFALEKLGLTKIDKIRVPSGKLTWLAGTWALNADGQFPFEDGDLPFLC